MPDLINIEVAQRALEMDLISLRQIDRVKSGQPVFSAKLNQTCTFEQLKELVKEENE